MKEDTEYSIPWKAVNTIAKITVKTIPYKAPLLFPCIKEWWAYVTITKSQIIVLFVSIIPVFYTNFFFFVLTKITICKYNIKPCV